MTTIQTINLNHYFTFSPNDFSSSQIKKFNIDIVEKGFLFSLTKEHFMEKDNNGISFLENLLAFPMPSDAEKLHTFNLLFTSLIQIFEEGNPSYVNDSILSLHKDIDELITIEKLVTKHIDNTENLKEIFTDYFEHIDKKINFPETQSETMMCLTLFAYISNFSPETAFQLNSLMFSKDIFPASYQHPVIKTVISNLLNNSLFLPEYTVFDEVDNFSIEVESLKFLFSRYFMRKQALIPIHAKNLDIYKGLPESYKNLTYSEQQIKAQSQKNLVESIDLHQYLPLNTQNIKKFEKEILQSNKFELLNKSHFYQTKNEISFIESLLHAPIRGNNEELYCLNILISKFYGLEFQMIKLHAINEKIKEYITEQFNFFKNNQFQFFREKLLSSINDNEALKKVIHHYYQNFNPDVNTISFKEHLSFSAFVVMIQDLIQEKTISTEQGKNLFMLFYNSDENHPGYIDSEYRSLLINFYSESLTIFVPPSKNIYIDYINSMIGQNLILEFLDRNKAKVRYEQLLTKIEDYEHKEITKPKI